MMSNDTELFDLCREVYERTGWGFVNEKFEDARNRLTSDNQIIYTSDYLLEKLPVGIQLYKGARGWTVNVGNSLQHSEGVYEVIREDNFKSDTPLKALLKLVIALDDAGVKL